MEAPGGIGFLDLVTLEQDVVPYVMDWPVIGTEEDGEPEVASLVVAKREGGFLAAVPVGFIPEEVLAAGNAESPLGLVGPSTVLQVPGVIIEDGRMAPTGTLLSVVVVDLGEEAVAQMRLTDAAEHYPFTFDADQPFAIPSPQDLLAAARAWVAADAESSVQFYFSAEGEVEDVADGTPDGGPGGETETPRPKRGARPPHGREKPSGGGKRHTVASLAASVEELLKMNAGLAQTVQTIAGRQQELERRSVQPLPQNQTPHAALRQPLSASVTVPQAPLGALMKQLGTPPRTQAPTASGLLSSPQFQPTDLLELEDEKRPRDQGTSSDPLAQAVLAQSQALTALVSQIAQQGGDPMLELSSVGTTAGTRGAQGRARLQQELAAQKGSFFQSVLTSMARRMQPTASAEGTPQELLDRGVCGTRYLERFGGFAKVRELGCLQQQVMSIMDCLQASNLQAARDQTALLAVTLDQAALDQGRFELANLLCLQEEPPATIFTSRQTNVLNRPRAFSPLADQRWVTVALAYIKELDVITTKRLELTSQSRPGTFTSASSGGDSTPAPNAKAKAQPKKKGKGGGRGSNHQASAETEEA